MTVVPVARLMPDANRADTSGMGLFPDEFPFSKREVEAPVEPVAIEVPLVKVGPIHDEVRVTPPPAPASAKVEAVQTDAATPSEAVASAEPPKKVKERRRSPRQRLAARATLRLDHTGGNPLGIEIDNVSLLGIRFRADRQLLVGDKANLRLEVGPLKWATRLRVINCLETDANVFAIGCEFVGNELARPWPVAA